MLNICSVSALLLLALRFRVGGLLGNSLWLDEAWVGLNAKAATFEQFLLSVSVTPVGFALATKASLSLFVGESELGARFLPLLFSIATLALAYAFARQLGGRVSGLASLLLLGFQPVLIDYAKVLKPFSADSALAIAILLVGYYWTVGPTRRRTIALVAVLVLAPAFSHPAIMVSCTFVGAMLVDAVLRHKSDRPIANLVSRRATVVVTAALLAATGFGVFALRYRNDALREFWRQSYLPADPLAAATLGYDRLVHLIAPGPGLGLLMLVMAMIAVVWSIKKGQYYLAAFLPILVGGSLLAAMLSFYPFGDPRTDHYLLAAVLTYAGSGLGIAFSWFQGRARVVALLGLVLLGLWWASGVPWDSLCGFKHREQVAPLVRILEAEQRAGDTVIVYYSTTYAYAYYSKGGSWRLVPATDGNATGFEVEFQDASVNRLTNHRGENAAYSADIARIIAANPNGRVWYIQSHIFGDEGQYIPAQIAHYGRVASRWDETNASLVLFER